MANGIELGTAYISLAADGSRLGRSIRDSVNGASGDVQRSGHGIGSKLAAGMGKALKGGAIVAGGAAAGALGFALTKGFQRLSAIDTAKKKLAGLGNSAKDIDKIMSNANASVKGTAFGLDEAATTAAGAVAAGIKPGKQLQGVLNTVADTATIAGSSMGDMGTIFGSVAARGKLQGDDLMQLQSRGVPVLAFLAKHYKTTAKEASVMVSKGQVDFKNFNAAMQENLGGAAKKSGDTVSGAFANLKASFGRVGAGLLAGVFPKIAPLLQNVTKAMGPLEDKAGELGASFGGFLAKGFDAVGNALHKVDWTAIGKAIGDVTGKARQIIGVLFKGDFTHGPFQEDSPVIGFFFDLRDSIGQLLPKVSAFARTIGGSLAGTFTALLPHLKTFASGMMQVGRDAGPLAVSIGKTLVAAFQALQPYLKALGLALGVAFVVALKVIPPILRGVVKALTGMFNIIRPILPILAGAAAGFVAFKIATTAWTVATRIAAAVSRAFAIAQALVTAAMDANPIMLVVIGIAALAAGLVLAYKKSETFRRIVDGAFSGVKAVASAVTGWFTKSFVPFFTKTIPAAFQTVLNFVKSHWKLILGLITGPIGAAVILVATHWSQIKHAFSSAWSWVKGTFGKAWSGLKTILLAPVKAGQWWISHYIAAVKKVFTTAWSWASTVFRKSWAGWQKLLSYPINLAKSAINREINGAKTIFRNVWSWASGTFRKSWNGIKSLFTSPITGAVNSIKNLLGRDAHSGLRGFFTRVKASIATVFNGLKSAFTKPIDAAKGVIRGFLNIWNGIVPGKLEIHVKGLAVGGSVPGRAGGGTIPGPWRGPRADNVLGLSSRGVPVARVNPGEYITNVAATRRMQRNHPGALEHINATGRLPGFAGGGQTPPYRPGKLPTMDAYLRALQKKYGVTILEHMPWDHVDPVHMKGSLHYKNEAADVSGGRGWPGTGNDIFNGALFKGLGAIWQSSGHYDHVHIDTGLYSVYKNATSLIKNARLAGGVTTGSSDSGNFLTNAFGDVVSWLTDKAMAPLHAIINGATGVISKAMPAPIGPGLGATIKGGLDGLLKWGSHKDAAYSMTSDLSAGTGNQSGVKKLGRSIASKLGVGGQFNAIDYIFSRESGWNPRAKNPSSGAYGIPQSLPGSKMASSGRDWRTNPATQIDWGIKYMKSRYGSPENAMAYWKTHHNYATGTSSAARGLNGVAENGAELVLSPQVRKFRGGEQVLNARQTSQILSGGSDKAPIHIEINGIQADNANAVAKELLYTMSRRGVGKHAGV